MRKKKLKLTNYEKRLLQYPPKEQTWVCLEFHAEGWKAIMSASHDSCMFCGAKKPDEPKLLWPDYVKACEKVGIEVGLMWKMKDGVTPMIRERGKTWRIVPDTTNQET